MAEASLIHADWPAPATVRAVSTRRGGGCSTGAYASFNLGDHVGDEPAAVLANRAGLREQAGLPGSPLWLRQVHGGVLVDAGRYRPGVAADGAFSTTPGQVLAILTADCLPVLLCARDGSRVAALHAGWRGLAAGILEAGVKALGTAAARQLAWLGPAIGPDAYEIGAEVRAQLIAGDAGAAACFRPSRPGHWYADLYALARSRLEAAGVGAIHGGGRCTFSEPGEFFSYRRDGSCGRMATLVWLQPGDPL
ncbi:MAG: peptidoglycan editing factor PgeF [Gammaproteobacteria bacterium]|jgi:hypothetical protein|nr:peptidoglycan editing factor PgeF [Gammaproteobacteria bacterium]